MRFVVFILALVSLFTAVVSAAPGIGGTPAKRMTNAERLARGLPPNAPIFRRALPGRDLTPTRAYAAKRGSPSSVPVTLTGRIQVRWIEGDASYGYVENSQSGINGVNFGGPIPELHVKITTTSSGAGPFDIEAINPNFPSPFFVGASSNEFAPPVAFGPGNSNAASLDNVKQTTPVSGISQSSLWSFDPTTKELTPHWVNPDGSVAETVIGFDIRNNAIVLTGDIAAYNAHNTWPVTPVHFFLVPF
ncbi:hypothetical protein K474DRAFT_1710642 [Panus rudis PR-1116 ss-1]|nr:hypothetical protein K474DRAFT_1710642 [Panus rudis PR-1116 ss-1]